MGTTRRRTPGGGLGNSTVPEAALQGQHEDLSVSPPSPNRDPYATTAAAISDLSLRAASGTSSWASGAVSLVARLVLQLDVSQEQLSTLPPR